PPVGKLRVWDVVDPRAPVQGGQWSLTPLASVHNVVVQGDSAYVSFYTEGVAVLDIGRPDLPRLVGTYDTYPGVSGGYNGCWGVYPCARTHRIYASDIQSGLFVLGFAPATPVVLQDLDAAAIDEGIEVTWRLSRGPGDDGTLVLERASASVEGGAALVDRGACPVESASFVDRDVDRGTPYVYRLVLLSSNGAWVLGERNMALPAIAAFRLLGASPNPFTPTAAVRFELSQPGDTRL